MLSALNQTNEKERSSLAERLSALQTEKETLELSLRNLQNVQVSISRIVLSASVPCYTRSFYNIKTFYTTPKFVFAKVMGNS